MKMMKKRIKMRANTRKIREINASFLRAEFSSHLHAWIVAVSRTAMIYGKLTVG